MKKRRLAGLLAVAPLALLCACGGGTTALSLSPNWYANTSSTNITGTYEQLEYDVTFVPDATLSYYVEYDTGSYKTTLTDETYTSGGVTSNVYHLTAEFAITGRYILNRQETETFSDHWRSDIWFRSVEESLRPIRSVKEMYSHTPDASPTLEKPSRVYQYTFTAEYDAGLQHATLSLEDISPQDDGSFVHFSPVSETISLSGTDTFLDNEQIVFGLRGTEMSGTMSVRTIDPTTRRAVSLTVGSPQASAEVGLRTFVVNGTETTVDSVNCFEVSLGYNSSYPGPDRTVVYARKTSSENNLYRNVPLRIEEPIMQSLGVMTYSLKKATFNNK